MSNLDKTFAPRISIKHYCQDSANIIPLWVDAPGSYASENKLRNGWSYRGSVEARRNSRAFFVTLTYAPEYLPQYYSDYCNNDKPTFYPKFIIDEYRRVRSLTTKEQNDYFHSYFSRFRYRVSTVHALDNLHYFACTLGLASTSLRTFPFINGSYIRPLPDFNPAFLNTTITTRTGMVLPNYRAYYRGFLLSKKRFEELRKDSLNNSKDSEYVAGILHRPHLLSFIQDFLQMVRPFCPQVTKYSHTFINTPHYMYSGEYGDEHSRPHFHILFYIPPYLNEISNKDFELQFRASWPYGKVDVKSVNMSQLSEVSSYINKHIVKHCCGTYFQKRVAPAFRYCSHAVDGIGSNLIIPSELGFDRLIYEDLLRRKGKSSPVVQHDEYYLTIPSVYRRKLFPDVRFSEKEILQSNFSYLVDTLTDVPFNVDVSVTGRETMHDLDVIILNSIVEQHKEFDFLLNYSDDEIYNFYTTLQKRYVKDDLDNRLYNYQKYASKKHIKKMC